MVLIVSVDGGYEFFGVDEEGVYNLGHASEQVQAIDGLHYYEGTFDTRGIYFENLRKCIELVSKWKPNRQIIVLKKDELDDFLSEVL